MPQFSSQGIAIAYEVHGTGRPILLIHGFGSSGKVNWIDTGWVETLVDAGYQPITFDNRGHGASRKLYDAQLYFAHEMALDAQRLLAHLGIDRCPVIGYSMGARIAGFLALAHPEMVSCAVFGGMGLNLISGLEDSEEIISALTAESLDQVTGRTGRMFRIFADHNKADRAALAACMVNSREPMSETQVRAISVPVLVAVGSDDVMAGSAQALADLMPDAEAFTIERRDHMRATGDKQFKQAALAFLSRHMDL
ncbi:alpha/beta fold hydrolase [Devosia sp.]|uniref:alpha/beta fold hydrolase n=1 Tax=Devosia sp. TaxID=1871048 RepID=UPI003BAC1F8A